jgi:hypothetical protein
MVGISLIRVITLTHPKIYKLMIGVNTAFGIGAVRVSPCGSITYNDGGGWVFGWEFVR